MFCRASAIDQIHRQLLDYFRARDVGAPPDLALYYAYQALEVMLVEGWVRGTLQRHKPRLTLTTPEQGAIIHENKDVARRLADAREAS